MKPAAAQPTTETDGNAIVPAQLQLCRSCSVQKPPSEFDGKQTCNQCRPLKKRKRAEAQARKLEEIATLKTSYHQVCAELSHSRQHYDLMRLSHTKLCWENDRLLEENQRLREENAIARGAPVPPSQSTSRTEQSSFRSSSMFDHNLIDAKNPLAGLSSGLQTGIPTTFGGLSANTLSAMNGCPLGVDSRDRHIPSLINIQQLSQYISRPQHMPTAADAGNGQKNEGLSTLLAVLGEEAQQKALHDKLLSSAGLALGQDVPTSVPTQRTTATFTPGVHSVPTASAANPIASSLTGITAGLDPLRSTAGPVICKAPANIMNGELRDAKCDVMV